MTINLTGHRHPEGKSLSEALRDDADALKHQRKSGVNKRATLIKAPDVPSPEGIGATMCPTPEELAQINQFTRKDVTADEVVCFTTMSMNDMSDRDDDFFTTETVKEFAALEPPFSPTGKSYMVDHEYKIGNARGRIFDTDTAKAGGSLYLTNKVYVPKTAQYADFIEGIDFGINWAVSVGVMLNAQECSLSFCKAPFASHGYWCQNGHDKGLHYTKDAEEDAWGFPKPTDPKAAGAEKCLRAFKGARDFYELSQVFLGAQYNAQIDQKVLAAAKSAGIPLLGVSEEEAAALPMRRLPRRLEEAYQKGFKVEEGEDGVLSWKDADRRVWLFDPEDPSTGVLGLGKEADDSEPTEEEVNESGEELEQLPEGDDDQGEPDDGDGEGGQVSGSSGEADSASDDGAEHAGGSEGEVAQEASEEESDDEEEASEEEEDMSKEAVLATARAAGLPNEVVRAASEGKGNGLQALLLAAQTRMKGLEHEVKELRPKAVMGEEFVKSLKKEALDLYIKAHATADKAVDVEKFERLLDKCDDDVELLKFHIDSQKSIVDEKYPASVRRSSFPSDPHSRPEVKEPVESDDDSKRVRRLHG